MSGRYSPWYSSPFTLPIWLPSWSRGRSSTSSVAWMITGSLSHFPISQCSNSVPYHGVTRTALWRGILKTCITTWRSSIKAASRTALKLSSPGEWTETFFFLSISSMFMRYMYILKKVIIYLHPRNTKGKYFLQDRLTQQNRLKAFYLIFCTVMLGYFTILILTLSWDKRSRWKCDYVRIAYYVISTERWTRLSMTAQS